MRKKKIELTNEDIDDLTSYADGAWRIQRKYNIDIGELAEAALNKNVEQCPGCRWWCESGELVNDDGEPDGKCDNCR